MKGKTIGIIAAMPEETEDLLKRLTIIRRNRLEGFLFYELEAGCKKLFLIESGVGMKKAAEACLALMGGTSPDIIMNIGFGGAPRPGTAVGDVVLATHLLFFKDGMLIEQKGLDLEAIADASTTLEADLPAYSFRVHRGTFVTTEEIVDKSTVARLIPMTAVNLILEMETAAVARTVSTQKIPLVAIRSVSDDAEEDLDFSICDFVDDDMRIRARKVFWALLKKPSLVPQIARLERNSRQAGKNLASAVLALLR